MNKELGQVIVLLAHPDMQRSNANKELYETVKDIDGVTVYNLYEESEELVFDIEEWSRILMDASALIFQFPFYWLSAPAMLKRWQDEVLTYLAKTPSIAGKPLMVVTTTGSESEAYRSGGKNRFTVDELLRPYQATAILSGMRWHSPLIVYGTNADDPAKTIAQGAIQYKKAVEELLRESNVLSMANW